MQLIIEQNGAGLNILISGKPDEVTREVNKLYNYGVITNIPDSFKEKNDKQEGDDWVVVQSDPGRFNRGMEAIAVAELFGDVDLKQALKGVAGGFIEEARLIAEEMKRRFVRGTMPRVLRYLPDTYGMAKSLD